MTGDLEAQRHAAAAALAVKRGEAEAARLEGPSRIMHEHLTERELAEMAGDPHEDLPGPKG
ncbi:DUF3008 family protein [Plastorhodobacter daqingensis]|uniref:DUF3008 family protein n=1 Tax=Plastorhodobacter daqingensis TaxID=1387281 RepID=A0ABW2UGZ0_9RHOB